MAHRIGIVSVRFVLNVRQTLSLIPTGVIFGMSWLTMRRG